MKVIKYFQQTFYGTTSGTPKEIVFRFDKIYKTNPLNKIRVSVVNLAIWQGVTTYKPHSAWAKGLTWGGSVSSGAYADAVLSKYRNDFCLGIVMGSSSSNSSGGSNTLPTYLVIDDLTTQPFSVYVCETDGDITTDASEVFITFQIEEISLDEVQPYR
jgi:hypothetical protein